MHYRPRRVLSVEHLDSAGVTEAEENLRDIARINCWFGGRRTLLRVLETLVGREDRFSILDVGAASGDMARSIQNRFRFARVVSLDRQPLHLKAAPTPRVAANALALPFAERSFDLVMCSSLLHHFSNDEGLALLRGMQYAAKRAVIVLDIERHVLAYYFLRLTRRLFRWSDLTVHDGCASVQAAFSYAELGALAQSMTARSIVVRRHRPWFRISMVIPDRHRS
jgi:SAM-dependent methyltransferase